MEEQKITFETAKLAKEKGFYFTTGNEGYNSNGNLCEIGVNNGEIIHYEVDITASTQSLLQKWLREVHNIYLESNPNASGYGWFIDKTNGTHIKSSQFDGPNDGGRWGIYEEALEVGLQEALKLI